MATLLTDSGEFAADAKDGTWLKAEDVARATGYVLKPEGMCRGDQCVPLPKEAVRDRRVDIAAFWRRVDAPMVADAAGEIFSLGTAAEDRNAALAGLSAPDFTLPDLTGKPHTLSQLRGKKVFLSTWASW
jgi:hypothetical protein